jgi:hypothetical protein
MRSTRLLAAASAALALAATNAHALVTSWGYTVSSQFVAPTTFTAGTGTQTVTPGQISWGETGGSTALGGTRSSLTISASPAAGTIATNGGPALGNIVTHTNNVLDGALATLLTASLSSTLTLTPLVPPNPALPPISQTFTIQFSETPNGGPCVIGATPCPDIFVLGAGALNQSFVYLGDTYFISIFEANNALNPLPPAACAAAGSASPCIGFTTAENAATPAQFAFLITSQPVTLLPEPGSLAALAALLLAMGFVMRRRRR